MRRFLFFLFPVLLGSPAPLAAELFRLQETFLQPIPQYSSFGMRLAFVYGTLAISSPRTFVGGFDSGRVYFFDPETWQEIKFIDDPDPFVTNNFGFSVTELGLGLIAIGSHRADTGALNAGAVHIINFDTGALVRTLLSPNPTINGSFGHQTATVGPYLLVGASGDINAASTAITAGAAYLFNPHSGDLIGAFDQPSPQAGDAFGLWMAVDEERVYLTAQSRDGAAANIGTVYVFDAGTRAFEREIVNPDPNEGDLFGGSISVHEGILAVGALTDDTQGTDAGAAYLFDATTGTLLDRIYSPEPRDFARFGVVTQDGARLAVGAPGSLAEEVPGEAFLFDAAGQVELQRFAGVSGDPSDGFGNPIRLFGNTLAIGAPTEDFQEFESPGAVYVYEFSELSASVSGWKLYE